MKKPPTLAKLKKKLDQVFSRWIRQRGADEGGTNECVSCGTLKHWKDLQAGHYYSRVFTALRWHPENVWPQCMRCNIFLKGNMIPYGRALVTLIGQERLDVMDSIHRHTMKLSRADIEAMIELYEVTQ